MLEDMPDFSSWIMAGKGPGGPFFNGHLVIFAKDFQLRIIAQEGITAPVVRIIRTFQEVGMTRHLFQGFEDANWRPYIG